MLVHANLIAGKVPESLDAKVFKTPGLVTMGDFSSYRQSGSPFTDLTAGVQKQVGHHGLS